MDKGGRDKSSVIKGLVPNGTYLRVNLRHSGAGRNPEPSAVIISLDSGLRRNDGYVAYKGVCALSKCHSGQYHLLEQNRET